MAPWDHRRVAPSRWFQGCPVFQSSAADMQWTVDRGLLREVITVDCMPDFAPWISSRQLGVRLHLLGYCTLNLPALPGSTSVQLLWLLLDQILQVGPEDVAIYWGDLPLLRPERHLAAYDLPEDVDLQVLAHVSGARRLHMHWGLIDMNMFVGPGCLMEQVRRAVAFQLGVNPLQVILSMGSEQLLGGVTCDSLLPESWVEVGVRSCPTTLLCDVCAARTVAASLCHACGRCVCRSHRYLCCSCQQFLCVHCSTGHACCNLRAPVFGSIEWWPCAV